MTTDNRQQTTDNFFRLGRLTGRIQITVDFAAGRPLLIEPSIRWKEEP